MPSSLEINPIATPLTCLGIGTPASINANEPAQTVAIEDEPFDSKTSDTTLNVYGKVVVSGNICFKERIAKLP